MDLSSKSITNVPELSAVLGNVLADLAFMVADDESPELPAGTVWLQGEIGYHGAQSGTLRLWCTRDLATRLAANLLGLDPEEGSALVGAEDAVREFMNVLCGQLVTTWYGSGPVFNLDIPTVTECIEVPKLNKTDEHGWCQLSVEGEPLLVTHTPEN